MTFDVEGFPPHEDLIDSNSLACLHAVLDLLDQYDFKGIFFIPASVAAQIERYPEFVERLSHHQIAYHSTTHSIKPRIFEYTDIPDYKQAVEASIQRETSQINLETGQNEGKGGITTLRRIFPRNQIVSFRAPYLAWSPPHLEALKNLGIKFDFSSYISESPVFFRGIVFYPGPITIDEIPATFVNRPDRNSLPEPIESALLRKKVVPLHMHPSSLLLHSYYCPGVRTATRWKTRTNLALCLLSLLLKRLSILQKGNLIEVTSSVRQDWQPLRVQDLDTKKVCWLSIRHPVNLFGYRPRLMYSHFKRFFNQDQID